MAPGWLELSLLVQATKYMEDWTVINAISRRVTNRDKIFRWQNERKAERVLRKGARGLFGGTGRFCVTVCEENNGRSSWKDSNLEKITPRSLPSLRSNPLRRTRGERTMWFMRIPLPSSQRLIRSFPTSISLTSWHKLLPLSLSRVCTGP